MRMAVMLVVLIEPLEASSTETLSIALLFKACAKLAKSHWPRTAYDSNSETKFLVDFFNLLRFFTVFSILRPSGSEQNVIRHVRVTAVRQLINFGFNGPGRIRTGDLSVISRMLQPS